MGRGNKEKKREKKNENSTELKNDPIENKEIEKERECDKKEKERENHETVLMDHVNSAIVDKMGINSIGTHETVNAGNNNSGMTNNLLEKRNDASTNEGSERKDKKSNKEKRKNEKNKNKKGEDTGGEIIHEQELNEYKGFNIQKEFRIDTGMMQEDRSNYNANNVAPTQNISKNEVISNSGYTGINECVDSNTTTTTNNTYTTVNINNNLNNLKEEGILIAENNVEGTKTKKNKKNVKPIEPNVNKEKLNMNATSSSKSEMNAVSEKGKGNVEWMKDSDGKYSVDTKGEYFQECIKSKEGEQESCMEENLSKIEDKMSSECTNKNVKKKEANKKKNAEKGTNRKKSNDKEISKIDKEEIKEKKDPKDDSAPMGKKKKNDKESKEELVEEMKDQIMKEENAKEGEKPNMEKNIEDEFKWNADEDIPLEELIYETTERSKKYNRHKFGLLGILKIMRQTDPDLNMLSLGIDLTTLGLNLNHAESLYSSFASPFSEDPTYKNDDFIKPKSYSNTLFQIRLSLLLKLKTETLFYIFYNLPRDALQAYAASELYIRKWVFHTVYKKWFTPVNHADFANLSKCKLWIYFEPHNSWSKKQHDDYLNVNDIMKVEEVTKCIEQIIKLQSSYNFNQNNSVHCNRNNNNNNSSAVPSSGNHMNNPKGNIENKNNNTGEDVNHNSVGMNHESMQ